MKYLALWSPGLQTFLENFVKPSGPLSYMVNVRSLTLTSTLLFSFVVLIQNAVFTWESILEDNQLD